MPSLTDFKLLSFDCYGTLIDWETLPPAHPWQDQHRLIKRFDELQKKFQRQEPKIAYNDCLAKCYTSIAEEASLECSPEQAASFGRAVKEWPAFEDTVAGLQRLKQRHELVILSNVDRDNVNGTLKGPLSGVDFDGVLIAGEIGSYKPSHENFQALFKYVKDEFGLSQADILHVAKSLPVDHVPAKQLGLTSAWIARGIDGNSAMGGQLNDLKTQVAFSWRLPSIGELAAEVDREAAAESAEAV